MKRAVPLLACLLLTSIPLSPVAQASPPVIRASMGADVYLPTHFCQVMRHGRWYQRWIAMLTHCAGQLWAQGANR